jgi:hypothetical protein
MLLPANPSEHEGIDRATRTTVPLPPSYKIAYPYHPLPISQDKKRVLFFRTQPLRFGATVRKTWVDLNRGQIDPTG